MCAKGFSAVLITELTGVAASTQRAYVQKAQNDKLDVNMPSRMDSENPNAKRPSGF